MCAKLAHPVLNNAVPQQTIADHHPDCRGRYNDAMGRKMALTPSMPAAWHIEG